MALVNTSGETYSTLKGVRATGKFQHPPNGYDHYQKYRAVLDIDGNSWSSRFPMLLCLNSPVIKIAPQWLGGVELSSVRPFVHYIPAPLNASLLTMVRWTLAAENQGKVREVVRNARQLCARRMNRYQMMKFMIDQLVFYVNKLQQGGIEWVDRWKRFLTDSNAMRKLFAATHRLR